LELVVNAPTGFDDAVLVPFDFYLPANGSANEAVLTSHCNGKYSLEAFTTTSSLLGQQSSKVTTGINRIGLDEIPLSGNMMFFSITSPDGYVKVYKTVR
jgi:hypothetical protein